MAERILIKRSTTDANTSNVVFGELAFTSNGNILYIGNQADNAIAIGGARTPGTLTANQAVVVDANSNIDLLKATDLIVIDSITSNSFTTNNFTVTGSSILSGNLTIDRVIAGDIEVANNLTVNGDIILRGSSLQLGDGGDVISIQATVNTSIIPTSSNSINLGSLVSYWKNLFVKDIYEPEGPALNKKVDVLWKKIGFNKTKTDDLTSKNEYDETIASSLIISPSDIWTDPIPSTKPASNTDTIIVYTDVECTEDTTSADKRTWKTNLSNWIPPRFGSTYLINVYVDSANSANASSNGTQLQPLGSGNEDEWYFDYQAGVLHFIGTNIPSSVTNATSVYITGAKYNGNTGFTGSVLTGAELVNATITSLTSPLAVSEGGTGVRSFTANSILAAANSDTLAFKTGSNGQVMLVTDNDVGFSDLDGGTY